jgi:hypothetical protein
MQLHTLACAALHFEPCGQHHQRIHYTAAAWTTSCKVEAVIHFFSSCQWAHSVAQRAVLKNREEPATATFAQRGFFAVFFFGIGN